MKILYIAPDLPYPLANGGKIRTFSLLRNVAKQHEVTLIAYDKQPETASRIEIFEEFCRRVISIPLTKEQSPEKKRQIQMMSLLSKKPYQYYSSFSTSMQQAIDETTSRESFDLIHVEFAQLGYHSLPQHLPRLLDQHNVEYDLLYRIYINESLSLRKLYCYLEWKKFKRDELRICSNFSLCAVTSERDKRVLQSDLPTTPFCVIPNGVDSNYFQQNGAEIAEDNTLLFTGTIDYYPNTDGLKYFLDAILPLIQVEVPDVKFIIAGKNPPPAIRQYADLRGVTITGFVQDMRTYYHKAIVVVVPLRMGGGTRLKILEAMAMKKAVVSTSIGAEGLEVQPGKEIVTADDPKHFARATVDLLRNADRRRKLAEAGHKVATTKYDWKSISDRLLNIYDRLTA